MQQPLWRSGAETWGDGRGRDRGRLVKGQRVLRGYLDEQPPGPHQASEHLLQRGLRTSPTFPVGLGKGCWEQLLCLWLPGGSRVSHGGPGTCGLGAPG